MKSLALLLLVLVGQGAAPPTKQEPATKLEITDVKPGKGVAAAKGDLVVVQYTGSLDGGKVFDSSKGKAPFTVNLGAGKVIAGWDQGLVGAKVGMVRKLRIPPSLGYGDQDLGDIPPKSTLNFEIEVLKIYKKGQKQVLEIEEVKEGEGPAAKAGDKVEIHYTGMFPNGVKFDSSVDRNQTFTFDLGKGNVIKGFDDGVTGMKKGGKRKITIPPSLGYGERGAGGVIPPNATLVFELELVSIKS